MKLLQTQFFLGPNLRASQSGLLAVMQIDGEAASLMEWRPDTSDLSRLILLLAQAIPVLPESSILRSPATIHEDKSPVFSLLLAVAEIVQRDFCVVPCLGSVIEFKSGRALVFLPCEDQTTGLAAVEFALEVARSLAALSTVNQSATLNRLQQSYREMRQTARQHNLNQSGMAMARAAFKLGIPHYRLVSPGQYLQLGQGCHRKRVMETSTDNTSAVAYMLCSDKFATAQLLARHHLPTPGSFAVTNMKQALQAVEALGYPVVVKPRGSNKGKGVTINITNQENVLYAIDNALAYKSGLLVERHVSGDDHRLLVVGGKLVAAARRVPAQVIGDGRQTIRRLVEQCNRDPRRGMPFERLLEQIRLNESSITTLSAAGLDPDSVPAVGQVVLLQGVANISQGGTSVDVTEHVHPDNREMAERVARLVGLDVAGIDFLTPDIRRSWREIPCAVLEVNATPGLRPHLSANPQRDVAGPVVSCLFPQDCEGRVPTAGITGSLGKTTTCRLVARMLSESGRVVALSTTQGAWIGEENICTGDVASGMMASTLLLDTRTEAGVFEFARGGLIKRGMMLDGVDVGAVINVLDNHIGQDGIRSREELARVKRIVVQHARKAVVLNADDPLSLGMRAELKVARVSLVSMERDSPALQAQLADGGLTAVIGDWNGAESLILRQGARVIGSVPVADIPTCLGGRFRPALQHALFAMAIAYEMGIDFPVIHLVLSQFDSSLAYNPGRMNFYQGLPYSLLVSHADGPEAMEALARFARKTEVSGKKSLLLCSAGNRTNEFICGMASAVAGAFTRYICCDWSDLRGRPPGEVAAMLAQTLENCGVPRHQISVAQSIDHAVRLAYEGLGPDDLLVDNTYDDCHHSFWHQMRGLSSPRQVVPSA